MNQHKFVTREEISAKQNTVQTLLRFMGALTFLRKVIVPVLVFIVAAAAIPPYFLWLSGKMVECAGQDQCLAVHQIFGWQISVPLTLASLVVVAIVATLLRLISWASFELSGHWSSQGIQAAMMGALSRVRTTFFDENPSGRLINRLVSDYNVLRQEGVTHMGDTLNGLAEVLCVGLLIMVANPVAGLLIIPAVLLYLGLQLQLAPMLSHAREIRSIKIGELLHRESDLIEGRTIFKLYNKHGNLLKRIHRAMADTLNIQLFYCRLQAWGMLWMGMISAAYAIIVYAFLIFGLHNGLISAVLAAVVVTAVFNLNNQFFNLAWDMSFLGEAATFARRAFFMIDLPNETTQESISRDLSNFEETYCDLRGDIVFDQYSMSYRADTPMILNSMSLRIPQGKKVGVIGRTGAGKSSVMQALFRMVYHRGGDIKIGEQSIFTMNINCLRSQFGVVPQDPYLFSGTIRFNLMGELTEANDSALRLALDTVGLECELDAQVSEGGRDYSVGERQLLCLARLILLQKRYILMDEPTSSLDRRTDEKIQTLLRTALADHTVVTIAHRLESLIHYDWIIELANGHLLREGTPQEIISSLSRAYPTSAIDYQIA
jgi:ABC-type multidrug transport system fused ATPase/permease subunit